MNMVIMITLGIIALVIMIALFTGKIKIFGKSQTCEARGGVCANANNCNAHEDKPIKIYTSDCSYYNQAGEKVEGEKGGQCCTDLR